MGLAQEVYHAGQELASAAERSLPDVLNRVLGCFLGWPYRVTSSCVTDQDGNRAERFAAVVYAAPEGVAIPESGAVPAGAAAVVIDACEELDLEWLRAAYGRIAQAKRLRKSAAPHLGGPPSTNVTLGIIFALRSGLPLDDLAEELNRLNVETPGGEWPNMLAVGSTGAITYSVQFPGEASFSGDWLFPAEGELADGVPPMCIVAVMRPTGAHTFNRMLASIIAHLAIFSPAAKVPNLTHILEGVPHQVLTLTGYQYNLAGNLLPVPRQFYNDRYLPPLPMRVEDHQGRLLSTLRFLPWQDGGVILLEGKLPLDGLLVFLGKEALGRAGLRVFRLPDVQLSYVLPITRANFNDLLTRIQSQTNMVVRRDEMQLTLQKIADEGSRSPFVARLFMGILRLRDAVYPDPAGRADFDRAHELVTSSLWNARTSVQEITQLWEGHVRKVTSGEVARLRGRTVEVDESIDRELRGRTEGFLNVAVRALKQGMQSIAKELDVDIGFLFQKDALFKRGIAALKANDPALAEYLRGTRTWSERLVNCRNAVEHDGWALPRVDYSHTDSGIGANEPSISGRPVTAFVTLMLDRLLCFFEEFTVHCIQRRLSSGFTIMEIPLAERLAEAPERFTLTLASGGRPAWEIRFRGTPFEET
jgi:hypothetical protein